MHHGREIHKRDFGTPSLRIHGWATWGLCCGLATVFNAPPTGKMAFETMVGWLLSSVLLPYLVEQMTNVKRAMGAQPNRRQISLIPYAQSDSVAGRLGSTLARQWAHAMDKIGTDNSPLTSGLGALLSTGVILSLATYAGRLATLLVAGAVILNAILSITAKRPGIGRNWAIQQGVAVSLSWALAVTLIAPPTWSIITQAVLAGLLVAGHLRAGRPGRLTGLLFLLGAIMATAIMLWKHQVWPAVGSALLAMTYLASRTPRNDKMSLRSHNLNTLSSCCCLAQ